MFRLESRRSIAGTLADLPTLIKTHFRAGPTPRCDDGAVTTARVPSAAEEVGASSLLSLVDRLHPTVLDVIVAPRGLEVSVGDPVIFDPAGEDEVRGAVVLAVGIAGDRALIPVLRELGEAAAAAVVIKTDGPVDKAVRDAAMDSEVALLRVPAALAWGQLHALLLTAARTAAKPAPAVAEAPLGDLFALADAVATAVGGATTIEDSASRVLAYSNLGHRIDLARQETILGRQVPSAWIQRLHDSGVFRRLWQTDEVVKIADFTAEDAGYLPRIAVAVRAGGELLGSIWVIEGESPFGVDAERALRDAADIAALHLLRHRTATDVDRQRRAELLVELLAGRSSAAAAPELLGLDPTHPATVVAFDLGDSQEVSDEVDAAVVAQRLADLVAVYCESYRRRAACVVDRSRVYALVPLDASGADDAARALAGSVVERARHALRTPVRAGLGSVVTDLDAIAVCRREADEVLDATAQQADASVASIDSVRPQVVLRRLVALARNDAFLLSGRVAAMAEQDAAKGTAWVATLQAYFDAFGDMAAAAAQVNVHPNTFRYRLRRITEVFGLDLNDADERLVAELQLRMIGPT